MNCSTRYRSHPQVVHQTVDGEAILIHMETGTYYSLHSAASVAWAILADGCSAKQLASTLQEICTNCPPDSVEEEAAAFIEQLNDENLLVESDEGAAATTPALASTQVPIAYGPLTFQKFTDMQDLLLADPIHEVSEAGWPMLPPGVRP